MPFEDFMLDDDFDGGAGVRDEEDVEALLAEFMTEDEE